MEKLNLISNYFLPDGERFISCHGLVTFREWLAEEMAWGEAIGRKTRIVPEVKLGRETGKVALARV
ncbi:MAG: hypothetical protein WC551_13665 [Patescibacteria group bacterium]